MAESSDEDWVTEMLAQGLLDQTGGSKLALGPDSAAGLGSLAMAGSALPSIDASDSTGSASTGSASTGSLSKEPARDGDSGQDPDVGSSEELEPRSSVAKSMMEWVVVLVGAVAVALVLRAFLFQAFWIPSESMENTLELQDRVLVNKVSYRLHDVNRGDVIVFRRADDDPAEIRDLIKRVIGVEGETVEGRDNAIFVDGQRLIESYLAADEVILDFGPITVEPDRLFVMGDNRNQSLDSRYFGTIPTDRVVGRAFVLFWPLNRISAL